MKTLCWLVGWSLLFSVGWGAVLSDGSDRSDRSDVLRLNWVVERVLGRNPSLRSARSAWRAMEARVPQAGAWEDPVAGVDVERDDTDFGDYRSTEWMIAQEIPVSGKNRQRARIATAEAGVAGAEVRGRELVWVARARAAYHAYANWHAQRDINRKNEALLRQFTVITRDKFEVGKRPQADVLAAETSLARVIEDRRDLELSLVESQTQLNTLMGADPGAPLGPPEAESYRPARLELPRLQALALEHRPELRGMARRVEAERNRVGLAKRAWIPDPQLRVEGRQFDGRGLGIREVDTGIFFSIPWVNPGKYRSAIAEARHQAESAEDALEAVRLETLGAVRDQSAAIGTLEHHVHVFSDRIVPLARQALEAALAAYAADRTTLVELIEAQRSLQEAESMLRHHLKDYLTALAELEPLVGVSLEVMMKPEDEP